MTWPTHLRSIIIVVLCAAACSSATIVEGGGTLSPSTSNSVTSSFPPTTEILSSPETSTRPTPTTVVSPGPAVRTMPPAPFEPRVPLELGADASAAELEAVDGLLVCTSFEIADSRPGLISLVADDVLLPISEFPGCDGEDAGALFGGPEGGTIHSHAADGSRLLPAGYLAGGVTRPIAEGHHVQVLDVGSVSGRAVAVALNEGPNRDLVLVDLENSSVGSLAQGLPEPFHLESASLGGNQVLLAVAADEPPGDLANTSVAGLRLLGLDGESVARDISTTSFGMGEVGPAALAPDGTSFVIAIHPSGGAVAVVVVETSNGDEIAWFEVAPAGHRVAGLRFDGGRILVMREMVRDFGFPMAHPVVIELASGTVTEIDFGADVGPWQLAFPLSSPDG